MAAALQGSGWMELEFGSFLADAMLSEESPREIRVEDVVNCRGISIQDAR